MEIQPIVIGTAGHIDHGKSTLVRALTGIDPDRLKEEKARGLTIDLGFAPLTLPDGRLVGIIDVPGHERFIKNMVAGASGIDLVVLVVAADDGVMPQTREHLSIMGLLGVKRGMIVLTKIDIVDEEMVELAEEDVRETVEGTFLEDAPLYRVSAISGEGFEPFKDALFAAAGKVEPRAADGVFRMPIQRVFTAKGFGTIVTGIPLSGSVKLGDTLEVLPGGMKGKVRGIQAYKQKAESARAGHSTAINLSDISHKEVKRGCVASAPGFFRAARLIGARLTMLPHLDRPLQNRAAIRLHTGTIEAVGEVILLDAVELQPGETGLVQIRLEEPVVCAPGDPFILRLASPLMSLGGGKILEESRFRLKRFKDFVIDGLDRQEQSLGTPMELLEVVMARGAEAVVAASDLAVEVKRPVEEVREMLTELASRGSVVHEEKTQKWVHIEVLERALDKVRAALTEWFDKNPLRELHEVRELRTALDMETAFLNFLLEEEQTRGGLELQVGGKVRLAGREVAMDDATRVLVKTIEDALEQAVFQPPSEDDLAASFGVTPKKLSPVVKMLVDSGRLVPLKNGLYLTESNAEKARDAVRANCEKNEQLVIPELRDALGTSRKFLIPILERLDAEGLTLRQGGHRILKRRS